MAGKNEGWDARGRLRPIWLQIDGGRDAWAKRAHSSGSTLSMVNTTEPDVKWRTLGIDLARRLVKAARELGVEITLLDLGAPEEALLEDVPTRSALDRLEELAERVADLAEREAKNTREIARLRARVRLLEDQGKQRGDAATGQ